MWNELQPSEAAMKSKTSPCGPNVAIRGGISWRIWRWLLTAARATMANVADCAMVSLAGNQSDLDLIHTSSTWTPNSAEKKLDP